MKNPLEEAVDEIREWQSFMLLEDGRLPCDRTESLVATIRRALKEDAYPDALESRLAEFLFMLGRVAFACHSSVYTTIALLHRNINPFRQINDAQRGEPPDLESVAMVLPKIVDTLSAEFALLPPSAVQPDFDGIDFDRIMSSPPDPFSDPKGASDWERDVAERNYHAETVRLFTEEAVAEILNQLKRVTEAFKKDKPPRVDAEGCIDFGLLAKMVEKSAELSYDRLLKRGNAKRVNINTPELERQRRVLNKTMTLVGEIRNYVARKRSSCAADLMKLKPLLKAQEDGVHQVGFADALKALMDALWRESVTPERPVVVVGGGTGGGRATPGPKMSSAKRDQQSMGVRDIENGRFKTPAAAAAHIVQLALPQWKDGGYTEKNRASLAQAIRRALQRAKRKKSRGAD